MKGFYQYPPDVQAQIDAMPRLRGSAYVRVYKAVMACDVATRALLEDYKAFGESTHKFTVTNLIYLAAKYQVSVKFFCEWLTEATMIYRDYKFFPSGIYERTFKDRKRDFTIPDLLAAARLQLESEAAQ